MSTVMQQAVVFAALTGTYIIRNIADPLYDVKTAAHELTDYLRIVTDDASS